MNDILSTQISTAWQLLQANQVEQSQALVDRVLARDPGNVSALACRAMGLWRVGGNQSVVMETMRRAVEAAPDVSALRHNFATILTDYGRLDEASAQYREALRLQPHDTMAFWGFGLNQRFAERSELIERMERLAGNPDLAALQREFLAYGLAKAMDDLGVPEKAFAYALEANRLGERPWDQGYAARLVEETADIARRDGFRACRTSGHPTRRPLFIVGMPRSGTTLVETILSRHPQVLALGESRQIPQAIEAAAPLLTPASDGRRRIVPAGELARDWLTARAEMLVREWQRVAAGRTVKVVTDKMPDNSLMLGLIQQLFPHARIIYMRRHPLDVGVSIFFQRLGESPSFTTRLEWIGVRTRQVAETMARWKRALDLDILDVSYEALVADPESQIRRILGFAGLDWVPEVLTPEKSQRAVHTASQWQVRQPISSRSVGRWRRYEPWLGPMIGAMGGFDWIDGEAGAGLG